MGSYLHRVVGLYVSKVEADEARDLVLSKGIAPTQVRVLTAMSTGTGIDGKADSDDVLKDLLRDGAIGTAVGTASRMRWPTGRPCWWCMHAPWLKPRWLNKL